MLNTIKLYLKYFLNYRNYKQITLMTHQNRQYLNLQICSKLSMKHKIYHSMLFSKEREMINEVRCDMHST